MVLPRKINVYRVFLVEMWSVWGKIGILYRKFLERSDQLEKALIFESREKFFKR